LNFCGYLITRELKDKLKSTFSAGGAAVAHGDTVGLKRPNQSSPRRGERIFRQPFSAAPSGAGNLERPTHGFTVGYYRLSLRDFKMIVYRQEWWLNFKTGGASREPM
jgi:hypothetical protein